MFIISKLIRKFLFFPLIFCLISTYAQKKRLELEREKLENQKKIEQTNKILEETRSKKTITIGQLNVISQQIIEKSNLINTYEEEIRLLDKEINEIERSINSVQKHLIDLKKEYAKMIYNAAKANDAQSKLMFLFTAETFNQLIMRINYFKFYSESRKKHTQQIRKIEGTLKNKRNQLYNKKQERTSVLITIKNENNNLNNLKKEQELTIKILSQREASLLVEIEERKKAQLKLEKLITELIKAELEKAAAKAEADKKKNKLPESNLNTSNFEAAKGKLNWPVQVGFISAKFGKRPHDVLKHVTVDNLGIDIQTNRGEQVKAVFEGVVTAVAEVPGMNNIVMIQHGDYYTFYAKLKSVSVKIGQKLKAKDPIGIVNTNEDAISEVQFQIWKGNEKQDPELWLLKK
jgi:septal ring factor EnvC (AmiA/AmiB activator)